jgi:hypothetical protein
MCTFEIAMRSTERRKSPILSSPIGFSSPFSQLRCGMHVYEPLNARTTTTLIAPLYRDGCTYVRTTRMYNISSCLVTSFTSAKKKPLPSHLRVGGWYDHPPILYILPSFILFFFPISADVGGIVSHPVMGGEKKRSFSCTPHPLLSRFVS